MSTANVIKLIDLLSFIFLVLLISTGALLEFTLPPRSGGLTVWALNRHDWGHLHLLISVGFLVLMSAHLFLHLKFIKSALRGQAGREKNYRLAIGLIGVMALLALAAAPLLSPVEGQVRAGSHFQSH